MVFAVRKDSESMREQDTFFMSVIGIKCAVTRISSDIRWKKKCSSGVIFSVVERHRGRHSGDEGSTRRHRVALKPVWVLHRAQLHSLAVERKREKKRVETCVSPAFSHASLRAETGKLCGSKGMTCHSRANHLCTAHAECARPWLKLLNSLINI